jgi:hypothetical protein
MIIGGWLKADEENEATRTRGQLIGPGIIGPIGKIAPTDRPPTVIVQAVMLPALSARKRPKKPGR